MIDVKFMFRYRIEVRDLNIDEFLMNSYRFSRVIEYLDILDCFQFNAISNYSFKNSKDYVLNI